MGRIGADLDSYKMRIILFVGITGEYGKPSESNVDIFLDMFSQIITNGSFNLGVDVREELEEKFAKENKAKFRGGIQFYEMIADLSNKRVTREEIKQAIENFVIPETVEHNESVDAIDTVDNTDKIEIVDFHDIDMISNVPLEKVEYEEKPEETDGLQITDVMSIDMEYSQQSEKTVNEEGNESPQDKNNINIIIPDEYKVKLDDDTIEKLKIQPEPCEKAEPFNWRSCENKDSRHYVIGINLDEEIDKAMQSMAHILEGVPGTGKTVLMLEILNRITSNNTVGGYKVITFSPEMSRAEFIGGVQLNGDTGKFEYTDGILMKMCKQADADPENTYCLGIDEISRGNTQAILAELITGIESRGTPITLFNGGTLVIPRNLLIVGTQNIADSSTKTLDKAITERFTHTELIPQWNLEYAKYLTMDTPEMTDTVLKVCNYMSEINDIIVNDTALGKHNVIGTRVITKSRNKTGITMEELKIAVKISIIPVVENRISRSSEDSREEIRDKLESIDLIVKIQDSKEKSNQA